jgi:hypothetical protein
MSFSDDPATPGASFPGDETGGIFDSLDLVLEAPATRERVVDTQSGFTIVVKRLQDRLSLSFKRQVGTPPSSAVALTPDESVSLARILSSSMVGLGGSAEPEPEAARGVRRRLPKFVAAVLPWWQTPRVLRAGLAAAAVVFLSVGGVIGFVVARQHQPVPRVVVSNVFSADKVDAFVRRFLTAMLDFKSESYRLSQIKAMAAMAPAIQEKYWKETSFPLSERQLARLPQGTSVRIVKIIQGKQEAHGACADVFAELVSPDGKAASPIHLKLTLATDADGAITVCGQEDVSVEPQPR